MAGESRPIRRTVRLPSQQSSQWMPPGRRSLVDELLEDENDSPDEFSGFAAFDRDTHEDYDHDRWRRTPFLDSGEEAAWEAERVRITERAEATGGADHDQAPEEQS